jgi:hypothetical protein
VWNSVMDAVAMVWGLNGLLPSSIWLSILSERDLDGHFSDSPEILAVVCLSAPRFATPVDPGKSGVWTNEKASLVKYRAQILGVEVPHQNFWGAQSQAQRLTHKAISHANHRSL